MHRWLPSLVLLLLLSTPAHAESFVKARARYGPKLLTEGPSPQPYTTEVPPKGVEVVKVPSAVGKMRGWYARPPGATAKKKVPAVIYAHGGFAFGAQDFEDARLFLDRGAALLTPTWRGENGNPGHFEAFFGEVDDLAAAARWLAARPEIDAERIYVFGHSAGGLLSVLLSLVPDVPVALTGSANGTYGTALFDDAQEEYPFDVRDSKSVALRLLQSHVAQMQRAHVGYLGTEDTLVQIGAVEAFEGAPAKNRLELHLVDGDHHSSLAASVDLFARRIGLPAPKTPAPKSRPATQDALLTMLSAERGPWLQGVSGVLDGLLCEVMRCQKVEVPNCSKVVRALVDACASQLGARIPARISLAEEQAIYGQVATCVGSAMEKKLGVVLDADCARAAIAQ